MNFSIAAARTFLFLLETGMVVTAMYSVTDWWLSWIDWFSFELQRLVFSLFSGSQSCQNWLEWLLQWSELKMIWPIYDRKMHWKFLYRIVLTSILQLAGCERLCCVCGCRSNVKDVWCINPSSRCLATSAAGVVGRVAKDQHHLSKFPSNLSDSLNSFVKCPLLVTCSLLFSERPWSLFTASAWIRS